MATPPPSAVCGPPCLTVLIFLFRLFFLSFPITPALFLAVSFPTSRWYASFPRGTNKLPTPRCRVFPLAPWVKLLFLKGSLSGLKGLLNFSFFLASFFFLREDVLFPRLSRHLPRRVLLSKRSFSGKRSSPFLSHNAFNFPSLFTKVSSVDFRAFFLQTIPFCSPAA